jgi:hypothetical protein
MEFLLMVYFYKLLATLSTLGILGVFAFWLVSSGTVKADIFPFTVLTGIASILTLAVNEVITNLYGMSLENKAMKERESLSTLLDEKLKPITDKLDMVSAKLDMVYENQITLVTELKTLDVIKHTPIMKK